MASNNPKHVIFLGAGASFTSGYPLANRLALLMSDRRTLFEEIVRCSKEVGESWPDEWFKRSAITIYLDKFNIAASLLRDGSFATMDELSRLSVGGAHASTSRDLKKLMRFVFALYNPHRLRLSQTDYRPLIQSLFGYSSRIRDDVCFISFNYDPYFEFSLRLAFLLRQKVNSHNPSEHDHLRQAITSGFEKPRDIAWTQREGFCHLKLHGTCIFPGDPSKTRKFLPVQPDDKMPLNSGDFFSPLPLEAKLGALVYPPFSQEDPPALLPWEIIHESGRLLSEEEFKAGVGDWQHVQLFPLFQSLWKRARHEVSTATKLSFVGLSVGGFMEPGFRYLFEGRTGSSQCVVVNPENEHFKSHNNAFHARSPVGKIYSMLEKTTEKEFQITRSNNEIRELFPVMEQFERLGKPYTPEITSYNTFRDFIAAEIP